MLDLGWLNVVDFLLSALGSGWDGFRFVCSARWWSDASACMT